MKKIWRNIHLWLGLAAGLIFFTECLSGTLLVFEDEITEALHAQRYHVIQNNRTAVSLDVLSAAVTAAYPKAKLNNIKVWKDPSKTIQVSISEKKKKTLLFADPYTARITDRVDPKQPTFFTFMLELHQTLLAGKTGKTILGISTFVVLIILITGMVLWFPKK